MSSLRNAVKRRTHKERAQPGERRKYGLLEKHKDYVLRAKDFHRKEQTLQNLREKAASRNPDEFYFKMISSNITGGIHRPKSEAKQYTHEELQLMKTQDIKYVLNKAQAEKKKVERLQATLHSTDQQPGNTHLYFAEDGEEAKKLRLTMFCKTEAVSKATLPKRIKKARDASYRELRERAERFEKLSNVITTMGLQRELMGKGRKRKLRENEITVPSELPVYKWRRERKK
ncbi:hypothetical protein O6H91_15G034400 [Diphasiastrum complanatum]|uniref:Uncharacterized protein n=1 Tax=Diphasiastrum complanatum TaxID=34168 RepID=A0ACC2BH75_DIPCM|nr:hypothetical protein O6H91_15G034400 [Diphasiastrum complanatum]